MKRKTKKRQAINLTPEILELMETYNSYFPQPMTRTGLMKRAMQVAVGIANGEYVLDEKENADNTILVSSRRAAEFARFACLGEAKFIQPTPYGIIFEMKGENHFFQTYPHNKERVTMIVKQYLSKFYPEIDLEAIKWELTDDLKTRTPNEQTAIPLRVPDRQEIEQS